MTADADAIRAAASVMFDPDHLVEVRAFTSSGRIMSGLFNDHAVMADQIAARTDDKGVYWTLNPCDPSLLLATDAHGGVRVPNRIEWPRGNGATKDVDIAKRRWILIDFDPERQTGTGATDAERAAAFMRADVVAGWLSEQGFPDPVRADSGNGCHLYYRVDLPNDAESTGLVKAFLEGLSARFSDDAVSVDTTVSNAARIVRIPGTINRKGDATDERPHRMARIVIVPPEIVIVTRDQIADATPDPVAVTPKKPTPKDRKIDLPAWLKRNAQAITDKGFTLTEKPKADHVYFAEITPCPFSDAHTDGAFIGQPAGKGPYVRCQHNTCGGAGSRNRWPDFKQLIAPKATEKPPKDTDENVHTVPFFENDGALYLVGITEDETFGFMHMENGALRVDARVTMANGTIKEPMRFARHQDSGELQRVVGLPRVDLVAAAPLLTAPEIARRIDAHVQKYVDLPQIEREVGTWYALYTWFYTKRATSPYLRYIGDTGKGKSRCGRVFADLSFFPLLLAGGSSNSAIMRQHERWKGTLFFEEADTKGGADDALIKFLNCGFERGTLLMLSDKNDPNKQQTFAPFGPKILAMRQPFRDNATESRCLSHSPRETRRDDIPPEFPPEYHTAVEELRALICRFVLANWGTFDPAWVVTVPGVEPRIRQMSEPVSCILQYFEDGPARYEAYVRQRQKDIKRTRAASWEGSLFNEALSLGIGDDDENDPVEAVLASTIAKGFGTSAKAVSAALQSIGCEIEHDRITVIVDGVSKRKLARKIVVPSPDVYDEITRRYFYDDSGGEPPECPDCLRGRRWIARRAPKRSTLAAFTEPEPEGEYEPAWSDFRNVGATPKPCYLCDATPSYYVASPSGDATDARAKWMCHSCRMKGAHVREMNASIL